MIRAHLTDGAPLTGRSLDTIARREYGTKAIFRYSQNPNDPAVGQFLIPTRHDPRTYRIGAVVLQVEAMP